jgi:hypothetical protein
MPEDFSVTWAHAIAFATAIAGYVIAFMPSIAPEKQLLIAGGATLISVAILIAHAIRSKSKPAPAPVPAPMPIPPDQARLML